jgi:hypothetical protein
VPLLRSKTEVHRARFRAGVAMYVVMAVVTMAFAAIVAAHDLLGWW